MKPRSRWTLAAATTGVVVAGAVVVPTIASADPDLPPTTAEDLLTDVASAEQRPFSGTVVHTTDLGLPQLPQGTGTGGSELTTLLAGSTTLRLWSDGPDRGRVAVLGAFAETDLVRNGQDAWVWRSDERTAVHAELPTEEELAAARPDGEVPADEVPGGAPEGLPGGTAGATPAEMAQQALAAVEPTTEVTLEGTTEVAGRDAYELVLDPRSDDSLVGQVRLAVDAETSYPLRVQVVPEGADAPALETGFTSISYATPGDEVFAFSPPEGTEVTEAPDLAGLLAQGQGAPDAGMRPEAPAGGEQEPTVVGEGWGSVVVLRGAADALQGGAGAEGSDAAGVGQALLEAFRPVSGDYGSGSVLTTSLLSVLALDDGRVLVGAVPPAVLEQAALDPTAAP